MPPEDYVPSHINWILDTLLDRSITFPEAFGITILHKDERGKYVNESSD